MTLSDDNAPLIENPDTKHRVVMCAVPDERARPAPEVIRAANAASAAPTWTPLEMSWRTRRWWPSAQGWWLFALPLIGFALTGRILTAHSDPPLAVWLGIPLLVMALLTIPAVAAIEFIPSNHQRTTARWTLRFDADAVTFIERPSGRSVKTTTIPRSEAGRIEISLLQAFDRRGKPLNLYEVDQVTAWSLDESSSMTLIPRYVYFGRFRSRERRPPRLLASWWPTNGLSEPSLDDFKKRPLRIYGH